MRARQKGNTEGFSHTLARREQHFLAPFDETLLPCTEQGQDDTHIPLVESVMAHRTCSFVVCVLRGGGGGVINATVSW